MRWTLVLIALLGHITWDAVLCVETDLATIHIQWIRSIGVFLTLGCITWYQSPDKIPFKWSTAIQLLIFSLLGFVFTPLFYTYGVHAASFRVAVTFNVFVPLALRWCIGISWGVLVMTGYTLSCLGASVIWWGFSVQDVELGMIWAAIALMGTHALCVVVWYWQVSRLVGPRLRFMTVGALFGALAFTLVNNEYEWAETHVMVLAVVAGVLGTSCKCYLMSEGSDVSLIDIVLLECLHPFVTYGTDLFFGMDDLNPHDTIGCLCILLGWLLTLC